MKFASVKLLCPLIFSLFFISASAQNFFRDAAESSMQLTGQKRVIIPQKYRTLQLDTSNILSFLKLIPSEKNISNRDMTPEIAIPMPDGTIARFHIWESSVLAPELAAANPNIKTFTGQGIDDKTATIKVDWTEFGFHAMILSPVTGSVFIDPYDQKTVINYISYYKIDYKKKDRFIELIKRLNPAVVKKISSPDNALAGICVGNQLRTYRLAIACTGEYAVAVTKPSAPTKPAVLSKIVTTVNRVDGVYEKELSIRLILVASENNIIFINSATDPFLNNNNGNGLLGESQRVIDSAIGNANYDIGHTFSTGGGGVASVGVVCQTDFKAGGVTGSPAPTGDPYDIDYVAHELGHQFGADHTFNSTQGGCDGNQSNISNVEPGSGSTIMAYAGICDADNLQPNSDAQFHTISFDEIVSYITLISPNCAAVTNTGNVAPVVNAGANYTIPVSTTFILSGTATDANGDALTYSWEEIDGGGPLGAWNAPSGNAPLFRSFTPVIGTPIRYFPKIRSVISGIDSIGEILPSYPRTIQFRLTARDNKAGGGGVCYAGITVTTVATTGTFSVTSPNAAGIAWNVNDFQTVTWSTGGTTQAPISATNVAIELSTDGGFTYPIVLAASTPNDGSQEIQVPNNITSQARVRVRALGNIFYDISDKDFTIQTATTPTFAFNNPDTVKICNGGTSGTATLKSASLKGFTTSISLSGSLNPGGTTVSFGTTSITPGNNTTVTLNNTAALALGNYTVRVTGVAGAVTKTKDIIFTVATSPAPPASLNSPANDATGIALKPSFNWSTVAGATSYILEISTSSTFSTIDQSISGITALPTTINTSLSENTVYYWRVKTITNCTSAPSAAKRFKTGITSCKTSIDVPKTILDINATTVSSIITIPASLGLAITDLNVIGLTGNHSYINDLKFTLTGPDNTSVVLLDAICDGPTYLFSLNVDDQGIDAASMICPPDQGETIKPVNLLSAFNGKNSTGTWTLKIDDRFNGDGGTLTGWGLNFNAGSNNCTILATPLVTTYTFTGNGNWNVASNWSNNTIPPSVLPSGGSIVINHAAGGQCVLNVSQTIGPGAGITVMTGKNLVIAGALTVK